MKLNSSIYIFLFLGLFILNSSLFSQTNSEIKPCGSLNMAVKLAAMYEVKNVDPQQTQKTDPINPTSINQPSSTSSKVTNPIVNATFARISGSSDIFGNLYTNVKPLQYNRYLNALTFIQRKSITYTPFSEGNAGTIVAMIGRNYGATWDSTCVWTNTLNVAQIPQGALYNPPSNLNVNNSYIVATGATMSGTNISGSFYTSKLTSSVGTNTPGVNEQFFSNATTFSTTTSPLMTKHDNPQFAFASTDDGVVRTVGMIYNDVNGATDAAKGLRGAHISKGVFTAGVMVWTSDSLIPPTLIKTDGSKQLWNQPYMAWNQSGTVGYAVMIGSKQGATGSNIGWQPIIYKTTNSGNNWSLVNSIDFNSNGWNFVLNSMSGVSTNTVLKIPFFNPAEGIDLTVDKCDNLHFVSTVLGTAKTDVDSLTYVHQYLINGENYSWPFVNQKWPYIFDFIFDGSLIWINRVIDSVGSEGSSNISNMPGFNSNPWANQNQIIPVSSSMRIQTSRTADGDCIFFSWAESDTTLTTGTTKWNEFPNIKLRSLRSCDREVSGNEFTISSPPSGFNPKVRDKAYFHHMSPLSSGMCSYSNSTFTVPFTVSNNSQTDGSFPVNHYCSVAICTYSFSNNPCAPIPDVPYPPPDCLQITLIPSKILKNSNLKIYPNAFSDSFEMKFTMTETSIITIELVGITGQKISTENIKVNSGENNYVFKQLGNLSSGMYFVNLITNKGTLTNKVIKE